MSCEPTSMQIIALFGPTGVGKTAVAVALAERLRARGEEPPVAVSADALQVYEGWRRSPAWPRARERGRARTSAGVVPAARRDVQRGAVLRSWRTRRSTGCSRPGGGRSGRGGTGLYLRAALTRAGLKPPPPEGCASAGRAELEAKGAPGAARDARSSARLRSRKGIDPNDGRRVMRALELLDAGELQAPDGESQLWSDECAARRCWWG